MSCYQKALVAEAAFSYATGTIMAELLLKLVCGSLSAARKHCLSLQFVFLLLASKTQPISAIAL